MKFAFSPQEDAFRSEVRLFLKEHLPEDLKSDFWEYTDSETLKRKQFMRILGEKKWLCMTWPPEYGGLGESHRKHWALIEEIAYAGAPRPGIAVGYVGPSILLYGTEEQKKFFLPLIAKGEIYFTQGFSEPNAGSDLTSLQTQAIESGDWFIVKGQKLFTSHAHISEYCYLIARTDPSVPKHRGISVFLVDMKTTGITVKPLKDLYGGDFFCEVFFDDVKIPRNTLLGEKNKGWEEIIATLDMERVHFGGGLFVTSACLGLLDELFKIGTEKRIQGTSLWNRLCELRVEAEVSRLLAYRALLIFERGEAFSVEASISKLFCSEFSQRIAQAALELLGLRGQLMERTPLNGRVAKMLLGIPCETIGAGTSEVQRTIIATRGLGLPRG